MANATRKLYWEYPYQKEFDAMVLSVNGNTVILDQTCFYAQSGGQIGDTGEINGVRVVDTIKNDSEEIMHMLEKPAAEAGFKSGDKVHGKIDWERRYKIMRLHSSAHVIYFALVKIYPGSNYASSGIVDDIRDKQDYIMPEGWDKTKLAEVEKLANAIIDSAKEIKTWTDEAGVRHWLVEGTLELAGVPEMHMHCGGTHVRNTKEIGHVTVKRGKKPGAGKERIEVTLIE